MELSWVKEKKKHEFIILWIRNMIWYKIASSFLLELSDDEEDRKTETPFMIFYPIRLRWKKNMHHNLIDWKHDFTQGVVFISYQTTKWIQKWKLHSWFFYHIRLRWKNIHHNFKDWRHDLMQDGVFFSYQISPTTKRIEKRKLHSCFFIPSGKGENKNTS